MAYPKRIGKAARAASALVLLAIQSYAQTPPEDHSCTVDVAGAFASPFGKDGHNFTTGWGFQAGGGFAVTRHAEPAHGAILYVTVNYMYNRLDASTSGLAQTIAADKQLASATSAHGSFSAVTLDPTVRFPVNLRTSLYLSGGFGWFRRGIGFNGANPASLTQSSGFTLDRLATNSGVFDLGGGVNFGLTRRGGLMLYAEARVYRGLTVNAGTTLLPISIGIRW